MATLGSLAGEINAMLGNRADVLSYSTFPTSPAPVDSDRLMLWLKDAYTDITLGYRFEELGQEVNDVMVRGIDRYPYPPLTRFLRAVTVLFPSIAGGQEPRPLRRRHIRNIRRYAANTQGPPRVYAPFNPGGVPSIIVRPVPDLAYNFIWDIQVKPTFNGTPNHTIDLTTIFLPDDWINVLKHYTKMIGHASLQEPDKQQAEQTYLFGGYDPQLGRRVPGVIKQLTAARDQLDIEDTEFGLQPQIRRFTNTV